MVRVRLIGGLSVEGVNLARLGSRKARRAFARLAVARGAPVSVDTLADVVWGQHQPSQPADQLSVLVSRLRSVVGAASVQRNNAGYRLELEWLDIAALDELAAEARRRLDAGAPAPAMAAARAALDLLRGALLPEEPPGTAWLDADRAALVRTAADVRVVAAEASLLAGDPWTAATLAGSAIEVEPFDEAALRVLMSAHAAAGRPALAVRAYAELAHRLGEELGVDPAPASQALHVAILRGEARAPVAAGTPGLVGRSAEFDTLRRAWQQALSGQPQLVVVEGEPGIGKSALLNELISTVAGATILTGHGDDLAGSLPLQPLLDAISVQLRAGPEPATVGALLSGDAEPVRPLLGLDVAGPGAGAGPGLADAVQGNDPEVELARLFAALDTIVARLAAARPVLWCVDDVQWADRSSQAWLRHVIRRLGGLRLLVVVARRSGEGPAWPGLVIRLGPLDQPAAAQALGLPEESDRLRDLFARSGGNPMFLRELAHSPADDLPTSIRESVIDRLERCGPEMAATLRAAAVLGTDVELDVLAAVVGQPVASLLDHLEEGVRRQFLTESRGGIHFTHVLVREALRVATIGPRRSLMHRQAARTLAARTHADPLTVAYHARLGDDAVLAAAALDQASQLAGARFDFAVARQLLDEAVELDAQPHRLLRRGRLLLRLSETAAARRDADAARESLAPDDPAHACAIEVAALAAYIDRDFERSRRLAEEAAALTNNRELRAACLALAGRVRHATGDLLGARALLDDVGRDAPASITPVVDLWRGFLAVHLDEPAQTLRLLTGEPVGSSRAGYPFAPVNRHMLAGYAQALQGQPALALAELRRMSDAAARESTDRFTGRDDNFRGWILRGVGAFAEADEANQRAYEQASALGLAEPVAHALLDLADGRLRAGDPASAAAHLASLARQAAGSYLFRWRAQLRARLIDGRCRLAVDDIAGAVEAFTAVVEEATRLAQRRYQVQGRLWLSLARRRAGEAVSPEAVAADLDRLVAVAPLEAWWLTAEVADAFDVAAWSALALARAEDLAAHSGPYAATLRAAATRPVRQSRARAVGTTRSVHHPNSSGLPALDQPS